MSPSLISSYKNIQTIGYLYGDVVQAFTMADSGINTIADFKGKKIGVGPAGSGNEFATRDVMSVAGLTFSDITPIKAPFKQIGDQFKDRQLAANVFLPGAEKYYKEKGILKK